VVGIERCRIVGEAERNAGRARIRVVGKHLDVTPLDDGNDTPQRKRILSIVAGLFAEQGFHAVGLTQIEKATGLTRGALYHHFSSKEELLYDISVRYITALVHSGRRCIEAEQDATRRISLLSRDLMRAVFVSAPEMTVCFREIGSLTGERRQYVFHMHKMYEEIWHECVADGIAEGVFRQVERLDVKGLMGMYLYSFLWLKRDDPEGYVEVADRFAALTLRALAA
jgi:TetR/AcrR family transcriptional regulator, cholesterol catabolism regulator